MQEDIISHNTNGIDLDPNSEQLLLQAPALVVIVKGEEGIFQFVNHNYSKLLGNRAVVGKSVKEVLPESYDSIITIYKKVLHTGEAFHGNEYPMMADWDDNGNPEERFFNFIYNPYYEAGKITGVIAFGFDVTTQVLARKKAEEKSNELSFLMDIMPQMVWYARPDGQAEFFNKIFQNYTGLSQEKLQGDGWISLLHTNDAETTGNFWQKAVTTGESYEVEHRLRRYDGAYRWFLTRGVPLKDKEGNIIRWYGTTTDIHEQKEQGEILEKKVQERTSELEHQKLFISSILDASFNGIYTLEAIRNSEGKITDFRYLFINNIVADFVGLHSDEIKGKTVLQIVPETKENDFFDRFCRVLDTGDSIKDQTHIKTSIFEGWFDYAIVPINKDRLVVTLQDITDEKDALQQIEEQRNLLNNILNHSPSGITVSEMIRNDRGEVIDGRSIIANTSAERYLGLPLEVTLSKTATELDPNILGSPLFQQALHTLKTGKPFITQYYFEPTNRWLEMSVAKMDDDHLINVFTDVTPIKETQIQLEKNLDELEKSNANLEEFAYAASHDMKEPIRKILFFTDRLKSTLSQKLNEEEQHIFQRLEYAANRMKTLIDDLLLYSFITKGSSLEDEVDLNKKIALVLDDLELEIQQKQAKLIIDPLPVITGHKRQLQQLFQNLIGNALKYHKDDVHPEIRITCNRVKGKEMPLSLEGEEASSDFYLIEVIDNGIGFDKDDSEKIFQMFTRLHGNTEYKGTGIGLSIVQKIVENHDGYIWAEGTPDEGSKFSILLPA